MRLLSKKFRHGLSFASLHIRGGLCSFVVIFSGYFHLYAVNTRYLKGGRPSRTTDIPKQIFWFQKIYFEVPVVSEGRDQDVNK